MVHMQTPVGYTGGPAAASVLGQLQRNSTLGANLTGPGSISGAPTLSVPTLALSVIPTLPTSLAQDFSAPQTISKVSVLGQDLAGLSATSPQASSRQDESAANALQGLVAQLDSARATGSADPTALSRRFFDVSSSLSAAVEEPAQSSDAAAPRLPPGVKRVQVDTVRKSADIDRLIPAHHQDLKKKLKERLGAMAPYQIYTYYDAYNKPFIGIDLAAKPELVDLLPDRQPHEIAMIKKLQLMEKDIRVLIEETGKTPDLVIGDHFVEMKAMFGDASTSQSLPNVLEHANEQIFEHAQRHGLPLHGMAAVHLTKNNAVPVERMQEEINEWQARPHSIVESVALDRVIIFSQRDLKVFVRQKDGNYQVEERYRVVDETGKSIFSRTPGRYIGNKTAKIFAPLYPKTGKSPMKQMKTKDQIFFTSQKAAIQAGYRIGKSFKSVLKDRGQSRKHKGARIAPTR